MRFVIAVPRFVNTGPVNGMAALANALSENYRVDFCAIRGGGNHVASLNPEIRLHNLVHQSLSDFICNMDEKPVLVSCCFSADLKSLFVNNSALKIMSIRGNLFRNYRYDYGYLGTVLAAVHLGLCRFSDVILAMNASMAKQIRKMSGKSSHLLPNFVDEKRLEPNRALISEIDPHRLVYVGSLSRRKSVETLIWTLSSFDNLTLDIIGDGAERKRLETLTERLGLGGRITFHGFLQNPIEKVRSARAFILPSFSEGYSRAALEALYLGVPCILRDVDANADMIRPGCNGFLFKRDGVLTEMLRRLMASPLQWEKTDCKRPILLPDQFRQTNAVNNFLSLVQDRLAT